MAIDINERLIAMMAVEKRLISEKQLTECLNIHEFFDPRPLLEILVDKGYIKARQVEKLQSLMDRGISGDVGDEQETEDSPFGVLSLRCHMVLPEQLEKAIAEQRDLKALKVRIPIGQILMSQGYVTSDQVRRILVMQGKNYLRCKEGCGRGFTVVGFRADEFYKCQKCGGDLEEDDPTPIDRAVIERYLTPPEDEDALEAWVVAADEDEAPAPDFDLSSIGQVEADIDEIDDDDEDDDEDDVEDLLVLDI